MNPLAHRLASLVVFLALIALAACAGDAPSEDAPSETADASAPAASGEGASAAASIPPGTRFNVNTATEEEMRTIPDVGDRMVHEFEEYRPYVSIQQFRREIGKYVDEAQVAAYEEYLFVPVRPNESDAETLQQLPGLDASEAEALIAERPFASPDAFMDALSGYVSAEDLTAAQQYLSSES